MKSIGMVLLLAGLSGVAIAGTAGVPEISATSGAAALAVLSGAILVIRGRRKRN
jgi:hypothetical protein